MSDESRGGMTTYQGIHRRRPLRAAATVGGFTDVEAVMAADERTRKAATAP